MRLKIKENVEKFTRENWHYMSKIFLGKLKQKGLFSIVMKPRPDKKSKIEDSEEWEIANEKAMGYLIDFLAPVQVMNVDIDADFLSQWNHLVDEFESKTLILTFNFNYNLKDMTDAAVFFS